MRDYSNTSFNQVNETDYEYIQAAANAKLFKNRLHLLAAAVEARRDGPRCRSDRAHRPSERPMISFMISFVPP